MSRYTITEVRPGMLMSLVLMADVGQLLVVVFYQGFVAHRTFDVHSSLIAQALIRHHFGD
jgi:hypothetical protein